VRLMVDSMDMGDITADMEMDITLIITIMLA
jgi:hypothetical protein